MKKVAAVVVTYNRKELLKQNLSALLHQTCDDCDILIVDNASSDGTSDAIKPVADQERVLYFNTGENLGGAGGFNFGMKKAVQAGYDFIWLMDDDCLPHPDALERLLSADAKLKGNYGFLSSVALWKDNSICKMNVQRHPLTRNITNFNQELIPATLASFVSLFISRKIVLELGLPIKDFFLWTDDWEYTRRISLKYPCYVAGKSVVMHASQENCGANIATDGPSRMERYRYLYRNDVYLYRREGLRGFLYEVPRLLFHMLRVLLHSKDFRLKKCGIIFSGTLKGFSFYPKIEYIGQDTNNISGSHYARS